MSRSRVPRFLKPLLVPLWNGGHRLAWRVGEYLDAVRSGRFERCTVCGRFGPILYRRWVIPQRLAELWGLSGPMAEALARKESNDCASCGAKLRVRRLAEALLRLPLNPGGAKSVHQWVRSPEARTLRVAEINLVDGLHRELVHLPGHSYSDFLSGADPGQIKDGVRHEDLMKLTYPDACFDLVITSETLEHVPDLATALSETARVLVPGGWHVFTIPLIPTVEKTFARATIDAEGQIHHHVQAIAHPGGDVGYPVFTEFGMDVIEILQRAGFEARMEFGPPTDRDLGQVFVTRLPAN